MSLDEFKPKLFTQLASGYGLTDLRKDVLAGITVAIVALPLAMAIATASGATPEKGLHTAIIAGLVVGLLGGSRFQIAGPTGAFIPVVYVIILSHGYDGLVLATLMAGLMLVLAGFLRIGSLLKYMPQPLITGFTAGIAVIIFTSQVKDLLGLTLEQVPAAMVAKIVAIGGAIGSTNPWALALAGIALATMLLLRRYAPRAPGLLIAVAIAALLTWALGLPVDTIGSRFGGIPSGLPSFQWPEITLARLQQLLPAALTIAFLAGVESLLSAVVADGMAGTRHRSNAELIGQGVANASSALIGGLPVTGAIARTATNIRAGARSPVSSLVHSLALLLFVLFLAPLAYHVPLPALAAVLVLVAWNMSEHERFRHLLSAPRGDRLVLLVTFGLTVFVDLTLAIEVGVVLASFLFMHRMASVVQVGSGMRLLDDPHDPDNGEPDAGQRGELPAGVEVFKIDGPLFFGVASRIETVFEQLPAGTRVFILRLRLVPIMDASGVHALLSLRDSCRKRGIVLVLSGAREQPQRVMARMGVVERAGELYIEPGFPQARERARALLAAKDECA